jgi:Xaa-Pro aminopeptidase
MTPTEDLVAQPTLGQEFVNVDRLQKKMAEAGVDAVIAVSPENTYYLSGVFIRTQISVPQRLALVLWPLGGEPTYIVCNIEETLARAHSPITDIRTYVEFAESPIATLVQVLEEKGLAGRRLGIEERFLTAHYYHELQRRAPRARLAAVDETAESVRAVKTPDEIDRIVEAYRKTEQVINEAWAASRLGDSEQLIARRMLLGLLDHGADSLRHITLAAGENTVHAHPRPSDRALRDGDLLLTDFGGNFFGFSSDMARMGIAGTPGQRELDEYTRYREVYVSLLHFIKPGVTAAEVYDFCKAEYARRGFPMTSPHVGHSVSRLAGHENPNLQPANRQVLEPDMLFAVEPSYKPAPDRRYHVEDLVRVTPTGCQIYTDWQSTERMIPIGR